MLVVISIGFYVYVCDLKINYVVTIRELKNISQLLVQESD